MVPGDFVEWEKDRLEKLGARPDSLTAWQQHQLIFDKTPLKSVVEIIQDQYGMTVELDNPATGEKTVTGIIQNNNLDVLLQALQATKDFDVSREGRTITIKAPSGH